ncbi:ecto-NOX disulfide-thiol exchanger 1-like [Anticarsia gemmatalis]|uniref:ecto-NOX disulfide-thiol exchanger 1-like n=1 Tax=Anticarsia gemmatalis TaxID=129554 RepID=UPI003F766BA7
MNTWGNEQFAMPNMMGMGGMMPNLIPGMGPPLVPPFGMMNDVNHQMVPPMGHLAPPGGHMAPPMNQNPAVSQMGVPMNNSQPLIGPVQPETNEGQQMTEADDQGAEDMQIVTPDKPSRSNRDRNDRRGRDRERGEGFPERRRRSRTRDDRDNYNKDRSNRNDRGDRLRSNHRERPTKWDNGDKYSQQQNVSNIMMQGHPQQPPHMIQYGNMMPNQLQNHMMPQQIDMSNIQMMQVGMMPNMMMINTQMHLPNQPIYFSTGVILPALPGSSTPPRRERPPGCRTIFVGGVPQGITEEVVMDIFQRFGPIDEIKLHNGVCHVRFEKQESVEPAFSVSGCRLKGHDQNENEATTLFIDYVMNREDQNEFEKNKRKREPTPPRIESYSATTLTSISDKIKNDTEFADAAPTLAAWLERGECNKKNANAFYSLIQASNNQLRRLFNEKMQIDEEFQTLKNSMKDKFAHILLQFEQVAKILTAAKHQRVSDHFSKQQRRNIEMWLKMTEELENIKEEFNAIFDDEETERGSRNVVSLEKYEQLRIENENLSYELEGYKNEAHLAKDEAERKFEKFKAHFIAQQALQNKQVYPPLPSPPMPKLSMDFNSSSSKPKPPPPLPEDKNKLSTPSVPTSDARLISMLSAFLMVHPRGASLDYLVSYIKSMVPAATQTSVHEVLNKYSDVFHRKTTGVGACIEHKWRFISFDSAQD